MKVMHLNCYFCQNQINHGDTYFLDKENKKSPICEGCFETEASPEDKQLDLITDREINIWTTGSFGKDFSQEFLKQIISGEYSVEEARSDLLSFKRFKKFIND